MKTRRSLSTGWLLVMMWIGGALVGFGVGSEFARHELDHDLKACTEALRAKEAP